MNVRFFAGTKSEYLSLPVPRNPLGLYFCEDTKELFWADRLLTDGTRVVPTFKDLPSFEKAAEGITYFVEETRNGYVLSSDRTDWVQVIYAPTTESSVKAISFAGIELEEVDGVFAIDRRCAREALGFKVPEGMEDEEIVIATEDFVKNEIKKIDTPEVNLDGYATETYVDEKFAAISIPDVSNFITMSDVEDKGYITDSVLADYAKTSDIPEVPTKVSELENDAKYATEEYIDNAIANIEHPVNPTKVSELDNDAGYITLADVPKTDLSNYYNKTETENLIAEAVESIEHPTVNLEGYATEEYVNEAVGNIEVPDVSNFITMEEVEAKGYINEVPAEYITENELEAKGYLTEHQDLSHLAEKDHVHAEYAAKEHEHDQYLTEHQDLSEYAKKSDIPEDEIFVIDFNAPDFAAALDAYNNGKLLLLTNAAPDTSSYAVMNYVREDLITFTKFLMSRSEAYGSFNTYYLHSDNTWEVSKEVRLNKVEANVEGEINGELTNIKIGKEVYSLPNTDGLASTEYVDNAIAGIEIPESEKVDLTGYATETWVNNQNFAKKTDVPSIEGLASEEYVTNAIQNIEIPEINDVPFTTDLFVNNPVGGFVVDDNVNGMTVAQLFTKLLGLAVQGDEEEKTIVGEIIKNETPMYQVDETGTPVEVPYKYIEFTEDTYAQSPSESGFYQLKDSDGNVIESGYQQVTSVNDSMYYVIVLPEALDLATNVTMQVYDTGNRVWQPVQIEMTNNIDFINEMFQDADIPVPEIDTTKYTLWMDASGETCTGADYRFIINE